MRGSDFYGIQRIFFNYSSFPVLDTFPYAVQHGWQPKATTYEASANPLEIWAWSKRSKENLSAFYPAEKIRITGSPYLYLKKPDKYFNKLDDDSAVFLLPHSTHHIEADFSYDNLCDLIITLKKKYSCIHILAYYLDVNAELCKKIKSVGSKILINGGIWSPDFLQKFKQNIKQYNTLLYSEPGSAVLFAAYEGLNTVYLDLDLKYKNISDQYSGTELKPYPQLAINFTDPAYIYNELGVDYVLPKKKMQKLILNGIKNSKFKELLRFRKQYRTSRKYDEINNLIPKLKLIESFNF